MNKWNGMCQRCYKDSSGHTMSWLNTQLICFTCSDSETNHPRFSEAKEAELKAIRSGNCNYEGLLHNANE